MTMGILGNRNQREMTVLYSLDFSFCNSELWRIDKIIG